MAEVAGKPFLHYVIEYLKLQGVTHVILSLGYKHELITNHPLIQNSPLKISTAIEDQPLGTGGGIQLALQQSKQEQVFVVNGDTFFDVPLTGMMQAHLSASAEATLALKPMNNFDRYGSVTLDADQKITAFHEKQFCTAGLINGGVYLLDKGKFFAATKAGVFSFEQDYLQARVPEGVLSGFPSDNYFIDIGIPSDFEKAQHDFSLGLPKAGI
jgi:D-glycero-alpha-D-manno-heptose 1-phosphate guanylyltransferase